jgi:hypothetical protein
MDAQPFGHAFTKLGGFDAEDDFCVVAIGSYFTTILLFFT